MRLTGAVVSRCRVCGLHPQRGTDKMCTVCRATLRTHPDLKQLAQYFKRWYSSG